MSAESQFSNVLPPEDGKIIAVTLDNTSRVYDLGALLIGGEHVERGGTLMLTLMGDVKFWFKFNSANSGTCNEAAADAAGAALTFQANACIEVNTNVVGLRLRWNRLRHRYLVVKGSAAGVLRIYPSSDKSNR